MKSWQSSLPLACAIAMLATTVRAQEGVYAVKSLTPDTALVAVKAALESCRKSGFQVGVAVVDRVGTLQAFVRDRYAGAHTIEMAQNKAWTAASFKTSSGAIGAETQPGKAMSGIRHLPRVIAAGGGLPIEAGGVLLGAIGVSGAPGGVEDDACATAGIKAIADAIEF